LAKRVVALVPVQPDDPPDHRLPLENLSSAYVTRYVGPGRHRAVRQDNLEMAMRLGGWAASLRTRFQQIVEAARPRVLQWITDGP